MPDEPAVASRVPSGLKHSPNTGPGLSLRSSFPLRASQMRIVQSQLAFAKRATQWEQDTVVSRKMAFDHYWGPQAKPEIKFQFG